MSAFRPPRDVVSDVADRAGAGEQVAELIRVRGLVQGVGFRPTVWRLARRHGLRGWVGNDGEGVIACVCGAAPAVAEFARQIVSGSPPLARIDQIERQPAPLLPPEADFRIVPSRSGGIRTGVVPDAATCRECREEIFDPAARRFRYPFTNCTHCGPRLSITEAIPYDRATTTMRTFELCADCAGEYDDPGDRRFHAQPIACGACGPRAGLAHADGRPVPGVTDAAAAARELLCGGYIVAVKGLGGFQLAADAANERAVDRLRLAKRREAKPFALMARDCDAVRRYCVVTAEEAAVLQSPAAPIVVMAARAGDRVAAGVAPGVGTLGFMLPNAPLHHLLLREFDGAIVLTSGNISDEPQCIANGEAVARLGGIADCFLMHDRDIACRVDDSVVRRIGGAVRVVRRARGYAPAPLPMPRGFAAAPPVLAMGGELKNTFCLLREGQAILSHHMGDLENAPTFCDYRRSIEQYLSLFAHAADTIAIDRHPEYLSSKLGFQMAERGAAKLAEVQHHHAHIAACLAENGVALDAGPVIGIALDGLGFGADGTLWGGEFLLADYRAYRRLACFKPVAMPGGAQAILEPWRNAYAHIVAALGWQRFAEQYGKTPLCRFLAGKPRAVLDGMIARRVNAPLASSCGRLFDAVAAAVGVCRERVQYEGQAAVELEFAAERSPIETEQLAYPFALARTQSGLLHVEPRPMWRALLGDVAANTAVPVMAARFHQGLAIALDRVVAALRRSDAEAAAATRVALSGGVFQNGVLLEQVTRRLASQGMQVLTHRDVPANDGGLALGQAAIAAADILAS